MGINGHRRNSLPAEFPIFGGNHLPHYIWEYVDHRPPAIWESTWSQTTYISPTNIADSIVWRYPRGSLRRATTILVVWDNQ